MQENKLCLCGCGRPLTGKQKKFASGECRSWLWIVSNPGYQTNYRKEHRPERKDNLLCLQCGTPLRGHERKYCSIVCNNKYNAQKKRTDPVVCKYCGETVPRKEGHQKYCDDICQKAALAERIKGKYDMPEKDTVDSICPFLNCGVRHKGSTKWEYCPKHSWVRSRSDYAETFSGVRA
jgi:hypothetical protein